MYEILTISHFDLGDEVIVGLSNGGVWNVDQPQVLQKNAFVIGKYRVGDNLGDNFCVGWTDARGYGLHKGYFNQWKNAPDTHNYVWIPNWEERFECISWLYAHMKVMRVEKRVLHKDQKCGVCALPAPHAEPNKDGTFVCSMCALRLELDR
jgi:hypothetical protein